MRLLERLDFTDDFDRTAPEVRRRAPERLILLSVVVPMCFPTVGAAPVLIWWSLTGLCEIGLWATTSPARLATRPILMRAGRLAATFLVSCGWASGGVLLWRYGGAAGPLNAVALCAGILLYSARSCHRHKVHLIASMTAPAALLALAPLTFLDQPWVALQLAGGFLLLITFSAGSAAAAHKGHRRLQESVERAEAASQAKSDFLANMSHEIRTPLNGVLGMAQAMANEPLPAAQRERLKVIADSGEALLALLNDLLDLAKIEAGKLEFEDSVVDFGSLGAQLEGVFGALAAAKDISLTVDVQPSAVGAWRGDPVRVRQVIWNLLSNAVKFTDRGGVGVIVRADASGVMIEVADTGPGIAPDHLAKVFDKFVQADSSTTRKFGGSGLGLAITRELVVRMGGEVDVSSRIGQGSRFTARLPLTRCDRACQSDTAANSRAPRGLRILVAEDHPLNQLVLKTLLEQAGLAAQFVGNGQEAVDAWAAGEWDLIFMDVQMPVMDGRAAVRTIREREAGVRRPRTPIIALTANAMSHHIEEYRGCGFDGIVPKPIEFPRLMDALANAGSGPSEAPAGSGRPRRAAGPP